MFNKIKKLNFFINFISVNKMISFNIDNFLRNSSFGILLFTMFFYWFKASFFSYSFLDTENKKFFVLKEKTNETNFKNFQYFLLLISTISLFLLLFIRWIETNHFPLSNLYESLIFLSWSLLFVLLLIEIKTKENLLGVLITPLALFINTFASFSLPPEMQKGTSLVPALQSNWLMMHVTVMLISYAFLLFGSLLSIAFLVLNFQIKTKVKKNIVMFNQTKQFQFSNTEQITENLDNLSSRLLGLGFPCLTLGILSGAIWANETWGSYWSWDPKETWALITWCVFAIYFHSRIIKGWKGEKPALIASFGFFVVWICYLGVNVFGKGLHSYGWIN
uniref:Cytochrome c biogenesis protein CcsA n=1 Tax=Neglectella solitaria TaxID=120749 RepID=C7BEJ2_NEGSO|nr:heme attachment to plastid cytochrome c [Neglectella solitaria]